MRPKYLLYTLLTGLAAMSCSGSKAESVQTDSQTDEPETPAVVFNSDSAYSYVKNQVDFGPRVPNTEAHRRCGEWLETELRRHGAQVTLQPMELRAFDGTLLQARNIMGSYNTDATDRLLLMAHWDTRPWADSDPDEANHRKAPDGANDGASGVGVLLEVARALAAKNPGRGVDILFLDAEDWGSHDQDDSWALGAEYFAQHPIKPGYSPSEAILVDMVGGQGSQFYREYQSQRAAPQLNDAIWNMAISSGYGNFFVNRLGGAVTDDHVKLIEAGIRAIDIIAFNPGSATGFPDTWHTMQDNMENIDPQVLGAVGQTLLNYIYR